MFDDSSLNLHAYKLRITELQNIEYSCILSALQIDFTFVF